MFLAVHAVNAVMAGPGGEQALAELVVGAGAGGVTFLVVAKILHVEELATLRRLLPGRAGAVPEPGRLPT